MGARPNVRGEEMISRVRCQSTEDQNVVFTVVFSYTFVLLFLFFSQSKDQRNLLKQLILLSAEILMQGGHSEFDL
jgi:hypothetical protein